MERTKQTIISMISGFLDVGDTRTLKQIQEHQWNNSKNIFFAISKFRKSTILKILETTGTEQ